VTPVNVCWSSSLLFCSTYINNFTATFHSLPSQIRTIFALWGVVARFDLNKFGNLSGSQTHNLKGPKLTLKNINQVFITLTHAIMASSHLLQKPELTPNPSASGCTKLDFSTVHLILTFLTP
jgi:hypothetical protein